MKVLHILGAPFRPGAAIGSRDPLGETLQDPCIEPNDLRIETYHAFPDLDGPLVSKETAKARDRRFEGDMCRVPLSLRPEQILQSLPR